MAFSYSFHLSNKKNAVATVGKVNQADKHNLRKYGKEEHDIVKLRGQEESILEDVKRIYHEEFDECLEKYNQRKRSDRVIKDYLQHVSDSRTDVAAELIIQVGDMEFWQNKSLEERMKLTPLFEDQIKALERLVPELKVASAVVHYDEASPHMHVVGVPVADGYKKGMAKQVAKTKVFTPNRLSFLQDEMRKEVEKSMKNYPELFTERLKAKEKGRNKDIPKESLTEFYELERGLQKLAKDVEAENTLKNDLKAEISLLEGDRAQITAQNEQMVIQAQQEAENVLARARRKAKEILEQANSKIQELKDEFLKLVGLKRELEEEIAELQSHRDQMLSFDERARSAKEIAELGNKVRRYEKVLGASPELKKHFNEVSKRLNHGANANDEKKI